MNVQKQTDVVVKCPDCLKVYVQRVTGEYIGPRRVVYAKDVQGILACTEHGQTVGPKGWVGLMRCADCSIRLAPPALRETLRKWLQEGERTL